MTATASPSAVSAFDLMRAHPLPAPPSARPGCAAAATCTVIGRRRRVHRVARCRPGRPRVARVVAVRLYEHDAELRSEQFVEEVTDSRVIRVLAVLAERHSEALGVQTLLAEVVLDGVDVGRDALGVLGEGLHAVALRVPPAGIERTGAACRVRDDAAVAGVRVRLDVPAPGGLHPVKLAPGEVERVALLDGCRDHIHHGRHAVLREHAVSAAVRVESAVVEGDQNRARGKAAAVSRAKAQVLSDRDRLVAGVVEHRHLARECLPADRIMVVRVVDPVIDEHRHRSRERRGGFEAPQLRSVQMDLRRRVRRRLVLTVEAGVRRDDRRSHQQQRDR